LADENASLTIRFSGATPHWEMIMNFKFLRSMAAMVGISASLSLGCGTSDGDHAPDLSVSHGHHEGDGHDHGSPGHSHIGPHGGHLIELGANEAYHAELVTDENAHRVTIYVLDGTAKRAVSIAQSELVVNIVGHGNPRQYKLAAIASEGQQGAMASCFQVESEELYAALDDKDAKGRLAVMIGGKQYVGEIERHNQDEHGHDEHGQAAKHDRNYQ
jgi:hypothetical protein